MIRNNECIVQHLWHVKTIMLTCKPPWWSLFWKLCHLCVIFLIAIFRSDRTRRLDHLHLNRQSDWLHFNSWQDSSVSLVWWMSLALSHPYSVTCASASSSYGYLLDSSRPFCLSVWSSCLRLRTEDGQTVPAQNWRGSISQSAEILDMSMFFCALNFPVMGDFKMSATEGTV